MIRLFDNPFSPFTRKVRMVLTHKELPFQSIDALAKNHREELIRVNPRAEVPVVDDGGFIVANSSEIVAYLEDRYPEPSVFPLAPKERARVRYWERLSDSFVDSVIHDISIWMWPTHKREDEPPAGLLDAGKRDLEELFEMMEASLNGAGFLCGQLTLADLSLFPHISVLRPLGVIIEQARHPRLYEWIRLMRSLPIVRNDWEYVKRMAAQQLLEGPSPYEDEKIVWRGDRLEWLFANGFHGWWLGELEAGRSSVPSWLSHRRSAEAPPRPSAALRDAGARLSMSNPILTCPRGRRRSIAGPALSPVSALQKSIPGFDCNREEAMLLNIRKSLNRLWTYLNVLDTLQDLPINLTHEEVAEQLDYGRD